LLPGSRPLAMAYAGHQFGNFVPQLGDGRAVLLGELIDSEGKRHDLQLKGAGRTPFSRGGDGRSALGPVLREYVVSEAMHALGIPTTRALAAVTTGEMVYREEPLPGAVLARVASSHIRVGTFQFFAARSNWEAVTRLADYVIDRHYPECRESDGPYLELLRTVGRRQAALIARWMAVGFIHGVMNTDNSSIAGETIDFGPCAFMDHYDPDKVFSSIDQMGRYAYSRQPGIGQWNLARFAETLLPLLAADEDAAIDLATEVLEGFVEQYQAEWLGSMGAKFGLGRPSPADAELFNDFLGLLAAGNADFTRSFSALTKALKADFSTGGLEAELEAQTKTGTDGDNALDRWVQRWQARLQAEGDTEQALKRMGTANPCIIPRNHRVEAVIQAGIEGDFNPFKTLHESLQNPYEVPEDDSLMEAPEPHERVMQTFCGT
ncbi:MAG: YdiU family protein, partial [Pseudomonadota bacterium]